LSTSRAEFRARDLARLHHTRAGSGVRWQPVSGCCPVGRHGRRALDQPEAISDFETQPSRKERRESGHRFALFELLAHAIHLTQRRILQAGRERLIKRRLRRDRERLIKRFSALLVCAECIHDLGCVRSRCHPDKPLALDA
jgi:hypothetical protein